MQPRPYQVQAIESTEKAFEESSKVLGVLPTGSGKTIVFSWLAQRRSERGERTLILAHREELIDQAIQKLYDATGIKAGKEKAEARASLGEKVVVGSVQSLVSDRRIARFNRDHFNLVVVDEAHHALASSYQSILSHFDGHAKVLGVTATPDRGDKRNLGSYFERIAFEVSLFDLIDQGYLSRISIKAVPMKIDLSGVGSMAGDFKEVDLGHAIEPYLDDIAAAIAEHAPMRKTLVFLPLIQTSIKFAESCAKAGINARHVSGESLDRKEIIESFASHDFDLLSNAMLLNEGYDDPRIDCVCVLRPTRSRSLYAQMVGRGTRTHDCKSDLLLLDFLWHHQAHSLCRPAHLVAKTEEEAERITEMTQGVGCPTELEGEQLDLGKLAQAEMHEREKRLLAKMAEHKDKKAKVISADEFAAARGKFDVAEYEPTMAWESQPVTEKQARYLRQAKIDLDSVRGKGHAMKLLDIHFGERNRTIQLASPKSVAIMRRMPGLAASVGVTDFSTVTLRQAGQFFMKLGKRKEVA